MSPPALSRRVARVVGLLCLSCLTLLIVCVALLQVPEVGSWVGRRLVNLLPITPGYRVEVGRIAGNWLTELRIDDLRLMQGDRALARAERLVLRYDPVSLLGSERRVRSVSLHGVAIVARRRGDTWDIARAVESSGGAEGGDRAWAVGRLDLSNVQLALHLSPDSLLKVRDLTLRATDVLGGDQLLLRLDTLHTTVIPPGPEAVPLDVATSGALTREVVRLDSVRIRSARSNLAGQMVLPRDFGNTEPGSRLAVSLRAAPLALADAAIFFPALVGEGHAQLEARAVSEGNLTTGTLTAQMGDGHLRLSGSRLVGNTPAVYQVSGEMHALDPAEVLRDAPRGTLSGAVEAKLRGESLRAASGTLTLRLNDSQLGATDLEAIELRAKMNAGRGDIGLRAMVADARVIARGWLRPFDSIPSYRLSGTALNIPGAKAVAGAFPGLAENPRLRLGFRVAGEGWTLEDAELSGRFRLAAVRQSGEQVPLGHATIRLADGRLRARPELQFAGGRVSGQVIATLGDTIRYHVRDGIFEHVSVGQLIGDTAAAPISGRFAVQGRAVEPEYAVVTARVQLNELQYGERRLTDVFARARLSGGLAVLDLDGALEGGTVEVAASARPFDTPVRFTIDSALLDGVDLGAFLNRPDWSSPVSLRASGSGRWGQRVRVLRGTLQLEPSRIGDIELTDGTVAMELEDGHLTYEASLQTESGSLALAGVGRLTDSIPSVTIRQGRVDSLDLGRFLGRTDLATSLDARFAGSAQGTDLKQMDGQLELELLRSRVNQAQLGPGEVHVAVTNGELDGRVRLQGPDAHLTADLSGALSGDMQRIAADGTIRLEELAHWTGDSARNGRLEGKFVLQAAADSAGLVSASGTVTAFGGLGRLRLQSFHAVLEPRAGSIVVDTLIVRSNVAAVDGAGSVALRDSGSADTLQLAGRTGDLNALAELAGIDSLTLDSARFGLTLTGTPERRHISGETVAHRLLYSSTLVEELEGQASATLDSAGLGTIAGDVQVHGLATGGITVHQGRVAGRYDSLMTFRGTADFGQGVHLDLAFQGQNAGDTTTLRVGRLQLDEGGRRWALAQPTRVDLRPQAVEIQQFRLRAGNHAVAVNGVLAFNDTSNLTVRVDSLELGALERAGVAPTPGRLSAALRLTGPARSPIVSGELALTLHDGEEDNLGQIRSTLEWTRRGLQLHAVAAHQRRGTLRVQGTLPWGFTLAPDDTTAPFAIAKQPGAALQLAVHADSFGLALLRPLIPPQIAQELRGELAADARIRGTPEQPRAEGTLRVAHLGFEIPAIDVTYQRGLLTGELSGDLLRVDTLLLHTGENQELSAQGQVRLLPLTNPSLDLQGRLRDFIVSNSPQLEARASGQIRLGGTFETPVLTGSLRVDQAEYVARGTAGLAVEDVELTPEDRLELARHFGPAVLARADDQGGFLERFQLDLDLRLPAQVWFRRPAAPELNVEVAGRIRLRQEPGGEMRFFGAVEPVPGRSTIDVYGRTFNLTEGEIVLNGPVDATQLEVTAEYQVPTQSGPDNEGVVISVAATGTPDSIALRLSSEPEMQQDDMLSYIVTGRPSSDNPLVTRSGEGAGGGELALGQLTEAVSATIGQELGFDVFHIRQDGTQGLMLTAGRYLTPEFYVSLQQPLEQSGQDAMAPGTNLGPGFELQYRMQPWLRVLLQGGSLPSGVLLRGRYAY